MEEFFDETEKSTDYWSGYGTAAVTGRSLRQAGTASTRAGPSSCPGASTYSGTCSYSCSQSSSRAG